MKPESGSAGEVFGAFFKLGMTSFGGPIAHVGYLRQEFVEHRCWLTEIHFAQLLAICQLLPGPASSQLGFAIGLLRGGVRGAVAAFLAFTLPSAALMLGFAASTPFLGDAFGESVVHGLKLVAVAVVGYGLFGMVRQLTPDASRILIASIALVLVLMTRSAWMQMVAILLGGVFGVWLRRNVPALLPEIPDFRLGRRTAAVSFALFLAALGLSISLAPSITPTASGLASTFYKAGALVFGGGHVVLPLLQNGLVDTGWLSRDVFLAGYGAAQAVPGPMFSVAAFFGAEASLEMPAVIGATIALLALFLPGFLLLLSVLPVWARIVQHPLAARVIAGVNAAVVGVLAAAFYDPVWTEAIGGVLDGIVAMVGFLLLAVARVSSLWVVLWCVAASVTAHLLG